jgi:putative hydrolase of the HAD superfamily
VSVRHKALLLDALGTLVRLDPPAPRLRFELAQRFGLHVSEAEATAAISAEIRYYRAHLDEGRDAASLVALRRRCGEVVRAALPASDALMALGADDLTEALLNSLHFTAFDDARDAIEAARAAGFRVVVASNWDVSLHEVLARVGLAPLVDGIVTSAEAGARKPDAAVFKRALVLAEAAPPEATHVGDSVDEDVHGALRAGIEAVLLSRDGRQAPPGIRQISSLRDLKLIDP